VDGTHLPTLKETKSSYFYCGLKEPMRLRRSCPLLITLTQCGNAYAAQVKAEKVEDSDIITSTSENTDHRNDKIIEGRLSKARDKSTKKRIRSSQLLSQRRDKRTHQEKDLRLQSTSLSDRWKFIQLESSNYADGNIDTSTAFSRLLREEANAHDASSTPDSVNATSKSKSSTSKSSNKPPRTFYTVAWSIALSTVTILAMTSATTFSSVLKEMPIENLKWGYISQTIPLLLSAEQEIATRLKTYFQTKFVPIGWQTMEKMILMEIWRSIWLKTFRTMRDIYIHWFGENYYECLWEKYAPGWIRRGVRSYFVKMLQGRLQNVVYGWVTRGWEVASFGFGSWWLDFEFVGDGDVDTIDDAETDSSETLQSGDMDESYVEELNSELLDDEDIELEMEFEEPASVDMDVINEIELNDDGDIFE